jgi:hypothetical protein
MKRIFAVVLLLLSFASAALADGSGGKPPVGRMAAGLPKIDVVLLADGSGKKPPQRIVVA